jgi:S-layer protein (TIGR01567 family)
MNKRMIVLIALVAVVLAMPASAETVEVRGNVADAACAAAGITWDAHNFGAFWYDLDDDLSTESLVLEAGKVSDWDRTIDEECLSYTTCPLYQEYELYACKGLTVGGSEGYYLEGWMGLPYAAIGGRADKLCELLVEFWGDDKKTLSTGESWDLGGGFALTAENLTCPCGTIGQCDSFTFTLSLSKNDVKLDEQTISVNASDDEQDRVYAYTPNIGGEEHIPVFSCYVDAGFHGTDSDLVQLMYVFLIDDDVIEIKCGDEYGVMEVMTASSSQVILINNEDTIDLDADTKEEIMGNIYFRTADEASAIMFYPMVEYTEPGTYEIRGAIEALDAANPTLTISNPCDTIADQGRVWDYSEFAGFWYDFDENLQSETLKILALDPATAAHTLNFAYNDRTLDENAVVYTTSPVFREYELHENEFDPDRTYQTAMEATYGLPIGLCVDSDKVGGDCGYYLEGWMGERYVTIDNNADKLCRLLVEFEDYDKKTLSTGEEWDLGGGFSLTANQINLNGDEVWFSLKKDGREVDSGFASTNATRQDRVYTYTANIGGGRWIPVFSCYVAAIFRGTDSNIAQVKYVFLIDDDVMEIETHDQYGVMEVMTASASYVRLENDETTIDLDEDCEGHIMGDIYFKTADDDTAIRFYPFVKRTIGGEEPTPPADTIPAIDTDNDGVPDAWDADNSTPADYWTDSDGRGRMWGDMNGDGKLTSADALMLLQAVAGKIDL